MGRLYMLFAGMIIIYGFAHAQKHYTLSGNVVDEGMQPLAGATVKLLPVKKGIVADRLGQFAINGLNKGTYFIEISFIGYKTVADTLTINGNVNYSARLVTAPLSLQEVVIIDHSAEERKKENTLNVEVASQSYLRQNMGGSLMQSLERLPGVTTIDIGSGQSKPVIRGLGFNRIVVAENGIKHEAQQWGADHGLEIDQYAIDNVEIIKGPASLIYGSDAIGGVIDMRNRKIPAENSLGANIDLTGKSNNAYMGSSLSVYGRKKWFFADFRATITDFADYKVPADSVDIYSYRAALYKNNMRNTAGGEKNLHLSFGLVQNGFQSKFYLSNIHSKSGFFANAHGLEPRNVDATLHNKSARDIQFPFQEVSHTKLINTGLYRWGAFKLDSDLGFQHNFRQEWGSYVNHGYMPAVFPDTLSFSPQLERQFEKYVYSANLKLTFEMNSKTQLTAGFNSDFQDNQINGRGFMIPAYKQANIGGFVLAKYAVSEKSTVQAGLRYDYGNIKTAAYSDWFPSLVITNGDTVAQYLQRAERLNRNFSNVSWSAGYNYNSEKWTLKANVGKSFRMPIAKELAANGVNYHHFSYEVGNAALKPETAYQLDAGIEFNSQAFAIGASPFVNYFSNYIYLNPSAQHDRLYGNGNQVYYYTQSKVFRYGGEIHSHYQVLRALQLGIMGEYVYSEQLSGSKKGFSLPFSPPASAIFNIKYQKQKIAVVGNAYLSADYRITAPQRNIVPPEETTAGYRVVNISLGGIVNIRNQSVSVSAQLLNLFNKKYFSHTSYYRLINVPEPGRNFIVNISVPFTGKMK